jgi:hypothetical protein
MVTLDVLFAELAEPLTEPKAADILELDRKGKLKGNARVQLAALESLPAFASYSEMANRVIGRTATGLSVMPIYNSVNVGTIVQATTRLQSDGTALVQIYVEKSALDRTNSQQPPELREPEGTIRFSAQSTVRVKLGEPVVLTTGPSNGASATSQSWILVTCPAR